MNAKTYDLVFIAGTLFFVETGYSIEAIMHRYALEANHRLVQYKNRIEPQLHIEHGESSRQLRLRGETMVSSGEAVPREQFTYVNSVGQTVNVSFMTGASS